MTRYEDERLGRALEALRKREHLTLDELASAAGVSRSTLARIRSGNAGTVKLDTTRRVLAVVDARVLVVVQWKGAELDRLLDARHAALVEKALAVLARRGWQVAAEVSFSEFGERGSIDFMAGHEVTRALLVGEVKSAIGSIEETNRKLDIKERLAPRLCQNRFGWRPATTSRVLVLPEDATLRRTVARHVVTLRSIYPADSRAVRAWLRHPVGRLSGIWFMTEAAERS